MATTIVFFKNFNFFWPIVFGLIATIFLTVGATTKSRHKKLKADNTNAKNQNINANIFILIGILLIILAGFALKLDKKGCDSQHTSFRHNYAIYCIQPNNPFR